MEVNNHLRRLIKELSWCIFSEENFNAEFSLKHTKEKMAEINKFLKEASQPDVEADREPCVVCLDWSNKDRRRNFCQNCGRQLK